MWLLPAFLSATLLVAGTAVAKKTPAERFDEYHAKSLRASPLRLSEVSYTSLTAAPRDFGAAILLTAMDSRVNCQLCREVQPEWNLVGKSWTKGDKAGESRLLFGTLDFTDGRDIFMSLGLQTAPVLMFFPPTSGPHAAASSKAVQFDFTRSPPTAESIHEWLSKQLPGRPHPPISRPLNWIRLLTSVTAFLGIVTAVATSWQYIQPVLQSRNLWASISVIAILLFISGHMYNHIRKVPYVTGDGRGGIAYFVGGFQNQLGLETQIVAALYGIMSFCAIALAVRVPRTAEPKKQLASAMSWSILLFLLFSFLLSVFRIKNNSYPFKLPPFM